MPLDRTDAEERLARIELMIAEYRELKQRQFVARALQHLKRTEAQQKFAALEARPELVH